MRLKAGPTCKVPLGAVFNSSFLLLKVVSLNTLVVVFSPDLLVKSSSVEYSNAMSLYNEFS
jgi:hypothetical protein